MTDDRTPLAETHEEGVNLLAIKLDEDAALAELAVALRAQAGSLSVEKAHILEEGLVELQRARVELLSAVTNAEANAYRATASRAFDLFRRAGFDMDSVLNPPRRVISVGKDNPE